MPPSPTVRQRGYFVASYNNQIGKPVGSASGVIGSVLAEAELVPTEFITLTVQVWATSFFRPETVILDVALAPVKVLVPSVQVAK